MDVLQWQNRPSLKQPIVVAAFRGWTDAGGAASGAATYLAEQWNARQFAAVDPEEFYDFTALRPQVRLTADRSREIVWPENRFLAASTPGARDVVLLIGIEPHLRWRTYCECVTTVAKTVGAEAVFTLGAMLTDVVHTRAAPVRVSPARSTRAPPVSWGCCKTRAPRRTSPSAPSWPRFPTTSRAPRRRRRSWL